MGEELKARFHDEKKIIKEILKEKEFEMVADTSFEEFATIVCEDKRSASLDAGNVKLTFNAYKIQKQKEEKEEARLLAIKNKADLEQFLMSTERMASTVKYYRCEEIFMDIPLWKSVPDAERREIYLDVVHNLSKKEKEEAKVLRKKNQTRLANILDQM